jgi:ketosteroid isomerase-like protein
MTLSGSVIRATVDREPLALRESGGDGVDTNTTSKELGQPDTVEASDFVHRFASAWARSDLDALMALLVEDVVLIQPMMPVAVGKTAARKEFTRLFGFIPDLRASVHRWAARDDVLFIEFTLEGTVGGRKVSWPAVDRFRLRDGLAVERVSYFDPLLLGLELLKRPRAWRRMLSSGFRPSFAASTHGGGS